MIPTAFEILHDLKTLYELFEFISETCMVIS